MEGSGINPYLRGLFDLLEGMEATDASGRRIPLDEATLAAISLLCDLRASPNKAMLIGNGGSAAIAAHLQVDLVNSVGVKALAFYDPPMVTAFSNDHGFEKVFERAVAAWSAAGDLLIAISSSGRSVNILRAVELARGRECRVITLSGFTVDNPLRRLGDLNFYVRSNAYGMVELAHSILAHHLTDAAKVSR